MQVSVLVAVIAVCICSVTEAVDLSVNGQPPLGAFGVNTLEHVIACSNLGMNLVYTYDAAAGKRQLDLDDPIGKAIAERKMKVMYILAGRFTRVRLARDITATDTTIPVVGEEKGSIQPFPKSGMLMIEGEHITYSDRTMDAFTGCRRGVGGTRPASHHAGLLLCNTEGLKQEILSVKNSPNLWGYWLVDDARPYEADSLREMSRVIRQYDRDAKGRANRHVIVMGVSGVSAMANFSPGVCDAIGVYPYPYRKGILDRGVRRELAYIATCARSLQPDVGIIGIYQAFKCDSPQWNVMPTPEQVREDILSFFPYGACGVMGFIYHWQGEGAEPFGFDSYPGVCEVISSTYSEIRSGKVKPGKFHTPRHLEWFEILTGPKAIPSTGVALFDFTKEESVNRMLKTTPQGLLKVENNEVAGHRYHVRFTAPKYESNNPKALQWPALTYRAEVLTTSDWSSFRYVEQELYNPTVNTLPLRVWVKDSSGEGEGWGRNAVPIPPKTPVLLRLPISEVAMVVDVKQIGFLMLWFDKPPEDYSLLVGNPVLVPHKR